jgi:phosphoserine phosphatase RsbU/P
MTSREAAGRDGGEQAKALVPPPRRAGASDLGDVTLLSGPQLPGAARAVVFDWLEGRTSASLLSDAQLLVSELATNSFIHGQGTNGDRVRLRAGTYDGSIWFELGDAGRGGVVARRAPSAEGSGGFGLHLVDHLASDWGVTHVDGTEVWFVLAA